MQPPADGGAEALGPSRDQDDFALHVALRLHSPRPANLAHRCPRLHSTPVRAPFRHRLQRSAGTAIALLHTLCMSLPRRRGGFRLPITCTRCSTRPASDTTPPARTSLASRVTS